MKFCKNCGFQMNDADTFCSACGSPVDNIPAPAQEAAPVAEANTPVTEETAAPQAPQANQPVPPMPPIPPEANGQAPVPPPPPAFQQPIYQPPYPQPQPAPFDPNDHTAEFTPEDISSNKIIAMSAYLLGIPGIIIALLASHESPYAAFHVRESLKLTIAGILGAICCAILCIVFIGLFLLPVLAIVLLVVRIICFFNVCSGKAKNAPIVGNLPFFK